MRRSVLAAGLAALCLAAPAQAAENDPLEIPPYRDGDPEIQWRVEVERFELRAQFALREGAVCETCPRSGTATVTLPRKRGGALMWLKRPRLRTGGGAAVVRAGTVTTADVIGVDGTPCRLTEPSGHSEEEFRMRLRRGRLRVAFSSPLLGYFLQSCSGPYDTELAAAGAFPDKTISGRALRRKRFTIRFDRSRQVALEHYDATLTQDVVLRFKRRR